MLLCDRMHRKGTGLGSPTVCQTVPVRTQQSFARTRKRCHAILPTMDLTAGHRRLPHSFPNPLRLCLSMAFASPVKAALGRLAFVTGGGQGIGRAIACRLARDGYDISIADVPSAKDRVGDVIREIQSYGRKAISVDAGVLLFAIILKKNERTCSGILTQTPPCAALARKTSGTLSR